MTTNLRKFDWVRCYRGKLPRHKRLLIYDSNERVSLVDSRRDRFYEHWEETTGGRIKFYAIVPQLPYETMPLFPEQRNSYNAFMRRRTAPASDEPELIPAD